MFIGVEIPLNCLAKLTHDGCQASYLRSSPLRSNEKHEARVETTGCLWEREQNLHYTERGPSLLRVTSYK